MPRNNHKRKRYLQKEKDRNKRYKKKIEKKTPIMGYDPEFLQMVERMQSGR